ncbi:C45 family autoproteolytic acyltransferase/hydrolase [Leptospira wolffii]|uniref:C45 family autoproteolytic acyltransferase/hydrolase n=1 Tax=Leptospira wolffii TaxID=409998 RepID=A0ABV5BMI8_9LEPT|nr:C45 family autoproteolytic acyltransferase/hydolase [Leptospira wolffii]TGL50836.1 acyl-CoA--6-aminopenicillanic acid acyltransferase [Leptospira wolffii]
MNPKTHPLAVIQLKGTQEEMGRQFGEIMQEIGQFEPIFDFYPVMAQNLLLGSLPRNKRNALSKATISFLVKAAQNRMRKTRPYEFSRRTLASLQAAGRSEKIEKDLFTMDAFQNSIGILGMLHVLPELSKFVGRENLPQIAACTSVGVWGNQSRDGKLYHARNFDFPGVGVWDVRPIVVFCTPEKGMKYGYVACRGADVPGITSFNEAGLTLAFHTRFHKKVGFDGLGVIDFGHKIISEARSIRDAVDLARRYKINSTWGAIVTNYKEKGPKAAIIETNYGDIDVTYSRPEKDSIINTNHYQSDRLRQGEILAAPVFYHHCLARYERAQGLLDSQRKKGTDVKDLQQILDDTADADGGQKKTMGSTIRQITSVKSVVMSPEAKKIYVSVGTAPTGSGPYLEIPMTWGPPGYKILETEKKKSKQKKNMTSSSSSISHYKNAMLINDDPTLGGTEDILKELRFASESEKGDPSLLFLQAVLQMESGRLRSAEELLEEAYRLEGSPFRKQQAGLWLARTQSALGKKASARQFYDSVLSTKNSPLGEVWKRKAISDKGKYSLRKLKNVTPNFLLVDANEL